MLKDLSFNLKLTKKNIIYSLKKNLLDLTQLSRTELYNHRKEKFLKLGNLQSITSPYIKKLNLVRTYLLVFRNFEGTQLFLYNDDHIIVCIY